MNRSHASSNWACYLMDSSRSGVTHIIDMRYRPEAKMFFVYKNLCNLSRNRI